MLGAICKTRGKEMKAWGGHIELSMEAEVEREVYPRGLELEAVKLIHFALVRARCASTGAVQRRQPVNLRVDRVNLSLWWPLAQRGTNARELIQRLKADPFRF
jgi:hypothetical protein